MNTIHAYPDRRPTVTLHLQGTLAALCCLFVFGANSVAQGGEKPSSGATVDFVRSTFEEYVATRRLISKERKAWVEGRETLAEQIDISKRNREEFKEKIAKQDALLAEKKGKMADYAKKRAALKLASENLESRVLVMEDRVRALLKRLPAPALKSVAAYVALLPEPGKEIDKSKVSIAKRFQAVVRVVNGVNKWNTKINTDNEEHQLDDGTRIQVKTLYIGVGQGYYVSDSKKYAGIGTATAAGWKWTEANDQAEKIAQAMAILEGASPDFVPLPVNIK